MGRVGDRQGPAGDPGLDGGLDRGLDPGLDGVVPFRFACQRSGRCCTVGTGYVFLAPGEVERLAAVCGMTAEAFRAEHVRTVPHPGHGGELREALRERDEAGGARCSLLEGSNECTVYEARPAHCRRFPYWPSVLRSTDGFERARATCPGIRIEPSHEARREAFRRLEALYRDLDELLEAVRPVCIARGVCCRFEEAGHVLYATGLEADYAVERHPSAPPPEAAGRCPFHVRGRCTAREGRPLGCRTYYCDPTLQDALQATHERFLGRIREIEAELAYPATYAPFPAQVVARGAGAERQNSREPGKTDGPEPSPSP